MAAEKTKIRYWIGELNKEIEDRIYQIYDVDADQQKLISETLG